MIRLFNINLDFKKLNTCFFNSRLNLFVLLILLLNSCAPKLKIIEGHQINNEIRKQNQIYIFSLYEKLPENAQVIGKVQTNSMIFSKVYKVNETLEIIKNAAYQLGGNAIKITEIKSPQIFRSSCYDIKADVLTVNLLPEIEYSIIDDNKQLEDSSTYLYIYRPRNILGSGISYPLFINNHFITGLDNGNKLLLK